MTSDEQRPSPIDGNRSVLNVRGGRRAVNELTPFRRPRARRPLSLSARLHLLSCDTSRTQVADAAQVPRLVRAGALTEPARRGRLVEADGIATPADMDASTGDTVRDGLLELTRESRPHRWGTRGTLHTGITLDAVRERLTAGGELRARKRRVLRLFPTVAYDLARPAVVEALQEEARQVLRGPVPAADVSDRDAALVALAAGAELPALLPRGEQRRARVEELIERSGQVAPVLRELVHGVRGAAASVAARA